MARRSVPADLHPVAGNGLLDRRFLLRAGAAVAAGAGAVTAAQAAPLKIAPWMREPGRPFEPYGRPSQFEAPVVRTYASLPGTSGTGSSRTPLHAMEGTITPNGLHFERLH